MRRNCGISLCIVTFPLADSGLTPLSNLVKLFSKLAGRVFVVSGGPALNHLELNERVQPMKTYHRVSSELFMRILNYIHTQLKILCRVAVISWKIDLFVFFIGGEDLLVPLLALKLLRKKVVLMPAGVATSMYSIRNDPLSRSLSLLISFDSRLADGLILYSHLLSRELDFVKFEHKITIAHEHFIDFNKFEISKRVDERLNRVGYIGRLSEEKGILNLLQAIPIVLKERPETDFVICGEGSLADQVANRIETERLEARVKLMNWIAHQDIPRYLNEIRLLVLPSFTEGLPNIILEAMACGTPVLATPVGAIPEIINDGENGFLLRSNNPEHIADSITKILENHQLLEKVSANACRYVKKEFNEERVLATWRRILQDLDIC